MAEQSAKAKGRKIGRNSKRGSTVRGKARYGQCQDNCAKRILNLILNGDPRTKEKVKPRLVDQQDGSYKINGYRGYLYIAHNKSLTRKA